MIEFDRKSQMDHHHRLYVDPYKLDSRSSMDIVHILMHLAKQIHSEYRMMHMAYEHVHKPIRMKSVIHY